MVIKKKWYELMNSVNRDGRLFKGDSQDGTYILLGEIDTLFQSQVGNSFTLKISLSNIYKNICESFLYYPLVSTRFIWKDLNIYMSSYDFADLSKINEIYLRLIQYAGFYKKILTDKGLLRKVTTHRDYRNAGHNESTNKNIYSETPQVSLQNFDDIINYISNANKVDDESDSTTYGDSDLTVDSASWEEAEKNLKHIFYNDLVSYISNIPYLLYREYSLDTTPYVDLQKEYYDYIKVLYER